MTNKFLMVSRQGVVGILLFACIVTFGSQVSWGQEVAEVSGVENTQNTENTNLLVNDYDPDILMMATRSVIILDDSNPMEDVTLEEGAEYCIRICLTCVDDGSGGYCELRADPSSWKIDGGPCYYENVQCDEYRFVSLGERIIFNLAACSGSYARIYVYRIYFPGEPCPWYP